MPPKEQRYFPDHDDFPRLFTPIQVPSSSSSQSQPATSTQTQTSQSTTTSQIQPTPSNYQYPFATSGGTYAQSGWGAPMGSYNYNVPQFSSNAFASPPPTYSSPSSIGYSSPPPSYSSYSQAQPGYNPYNTTTNAYYQQASSSTQSVPQPLSNPNINSFEAANAPCYWGCGLCGKKRPEKGYAWCWRCNVSTSGALYSGTGDD